MAIIKAKTFQEAFISCVSECINKPEFVIESRNGSANEILNLTYEVEDVESFEFENKTIGRIDYEYANDFFMWMMSGSTDIKELVEKYPNVSRFLEKPKSDLLPDNFNTFYGPRIMSQFNDIIEELSTKTNSRRAVISILEQSDTKLLNKNEEIEFPCTDSLTLMIRNKKLYATLNMRSQNMGQVAKLDMYLWGRLVCYIAKLVGVKPVKFTSNIVSAHVFDIDTDYLHKNVLNAL